MSGSACPVIEAHWSISERCLHAFGREGEKNKQISDLLALDRYREMEDSNQLFIVHSTAHTGKCILAFNPILLLGAVSQIPTD